MDKVVYTYKNNRSFNDLINLYLDTAVVRRIGSKSKEFNLVRGGKMAIFASDYIGIHINQYGFYDDAELRMVFAFLAPVSKEIGLGVALDIGANIGNHSIYFSKYFTSIRSFEPHPRIFDLLLFNSKIASNIIPYNFGLGDEEKDLELNENWENMGSSSIKHNLNADDMKVNIRIRRLDDINLNADMISFVKIDVEGFEANVIQGGLVTIRKHQPLIVLEQMESEFINDTTVTLDLLKKEGYIFCWFQPWAVARGWLVRRVNTVKNILLGGTYDYNVIASVSPPKTTYDMLIAVPVRFQAQLLGGSRLSSP